MKIYSTNEDFFKDLNDFIARLDKAGAGQAAAEIRSGMRYLNGLTDGWAMLMESMEKTLNIYKEQITKEHYSELRAYFAIVKKIVFR